MPWLDNNALVNLKATDIRICIYCTKKILNHGCFLQNTMRSLRRYYLSYDANILAEVWDCDCHRAMYVACMYEYVLLRVYCINNFLSCWRFIESKILLEYEPASLYSCNNHDATISSFFVMNWWLVYVICKITKWDIVHR